MQSLVPDVLTAWREAERLARRLESGSPEQRAALNAVARLRLLYADLTAGRAPQAQVPALRVVLDEIRQGLDTQPAR